MLIEDKNDVNVILLKAIKSNFNMFMDFIESRLNNINLSREIFTKILTASEEIIVNIINYAYPDKEGFLKIIFLLMGDKIELTFIDSGSAFNPLDVAEFDTSLTIEQRGEGGLGILMVKKLMDDVCYEYKGSENRLTITKYLKSNN